MSRGQVQFAAHVDLLHLFLDRRVEVVERIEGVLNAQRKPIEYLPNTLPLSRRVEDCFFTLAGTAGGPLRLRGQLEQAHWDSGFKPRELPGLHNGLIEPAEMMVRGVHLWRQTRWPGRNGRLRYAHTLFNLYVLRNLELLSMRLWDAGRQAAPERLSQVQGVLDRLWHTAPADQPVLVRDARWLIQMAQSPATDDLGAYFDVAAEISESLSEADRTAIYRAGVRMAGGHLRSQLHYYAAKKGVPLDDLSVVVNTRSSNALDFALLIQELVPLLHVYEDACRAGDHPDRLEVADAICQGISPDPELFVNRVELLAAYSMIEHLFITTDPDGCPAFTAMGQRHVRSIEEYATLISRLSKPLYEDCSSFQPVEGTFSPYGLLYGFSTDLVEHMAFRTLVPDAVTHFSLEDVFANGSAEKLSWVNGWRKLPHVPPDVQKLFDYPQRFAEAVFARIVRALRTRALQDDASAAVRTGRLFVLPEDDPLADSTASQMPDLPLRYVRSSDEQVVAAGRAELDEERGLSGDRREGKHLIAYRTPGGWVAITKAVLTEVLGRGRDVKIAGLPPAAAQAMKMMYPDLVVRSEAAAGRCASSGQIEVR